MITKAIEEQLKAIIKDVLSTQGGWKKFKALLVEQGEWKVISHTETLVTITVIGTTNGSRIKFTEKIDILEPPRVAP